MSTLKRSALIGGSIIILAAATIAGLELSNTTHWFHQQQPVKVKINGNKTATANPNVPSSQNKPSNLAGPTGLSSPKSGGTGTNQNQPGQIAPGVQPSQPIGQFVSDHHPSSINESEVSACTTTPGATCQITFTNGSTSRSLQALVTNGNGSVTWNWTPAQIGLAAGNWQITATASNGSKTASVTDKQNLVIP